jgi:DNA-binding CsgD family transcriptional regulator
VSASRLTPREQRVARLAAEGRATPEIARDLNLSAKTVETHLFRVYRKLGIRSRAELGRLLGSPRPGGSEDEPGDLCSGAAAPAIVVSSVVRGES